MGFVVEYTGVYLERRKGTTVIDADGMYLDENDDYYFYHKTDSGRQFAGSIPRINVLSIKPTEDHFQDAGD